MVSRQGRQRNSNDQTNELEKNPLCASEISGFGPTYSRTVRINGFDGSDGGPISGTPPTIGVESRMAHRCPWGINSQGEGAWGVM